MTVRTVTNVGTDAVQVMGAAKARTSWVLYNGSAVNAYWNNNRPSGTTDGFIIPAGGNFTLKIPEDDPTQEVWMIAGAAATPIYVYEGYGGLRVNA